MAKKPSLSLCMILKDESSFLKKCLESINKFVDEIIVVDTGSKDDTIKIAKSFGAKVIEHKWSDNFSKARNVSLKYATKDWILVLDADETISEKDLEEIRNLFDDADAISLIQRNYFKEKVPTTIEVSSKGDAYSESKSYSGWFPSRLVRMFKNNKGYEFTGAIHELIEPSIKQRGGKIKPSKIPIHHFKFEKGKEWALGKKQKYLELGKKQIKLTPNDPKPYFEVGVLYVDSKKTDNAISMFEKALELIEVSKNPKKHIGTFAYVNYHLGFAYMEKNRYQDAAKCFKRLTERFPKAASNYFHLAQAYAMMNRFNQAIETYEKAAELSPNDPEIHNNLANLYSRTGNFEMAINQFKIALGLAPENATIHRNLGATYFGMKKYANAFEHFKKAVELNPEFEKDLGDAIRQLEKIKDKALDVDYSFSIG